MKLIWMKQLDKDINISLWRGTCKLCLLITNTYEKITSNDSSR